MDKKRQVVLGAIFLLTVFHAVTVFGQETRLQRGDSLKLEVPQRADLGRIIAINDRGEVTLPIVGAIRIEGLTLAEANTAILKSLQEIYPSVPSIVLTLAGGVTQRFLYVQGQVASPGKFEFQGNPTVWDAIREAGGATAAASIESVRIIRMEGGRSTTTIVNVRQALDAGSLQSLPPLKPGDTIIVPEKAAALEGTGTGAVNIIGAVLRPSSYIIGADKRLVDAILAAGGATDAANLSKVKVIRPLSEGGMMTVNIDFQRYLKTGDPRHNPLILPNDTVSIPRSNPLKIFFTDPRILLALITATVTTATIIATR